MVHCWHRFFFCFSLSSLPSILKLCYFFQTKAKSIFVFAFSIIQFFIIIVIVIFIIYSHLLSTVCSLFSNSLKHLRRTLIFSTSYINMVFELYVSPKHCFNKILPVLICSVLLFICLKKFIIFIVKIFFFLTHDFKSGLVNSQGHGNFVLIFLYYFLV